MVGPVLVVDPAYMCFLSNVRDLACDTHVFSLLHMHMLFKNLTNFYNSL